MMRRSIFDKHHKRWLLHLDGKPLNDCIEFDTRVGCATVYRRDENNNLMVVDDDHLTTRLVTGLITAKWVS